MQLENITFLNSVITHDFIQAMRLQISCQFLTHSLVQWLEYFLHRHSLNFSVAMPVWNFVSLPRRTCFTKHLSCPVW